MSEVGQDRMTPSEIDFHDISVWSLKDALKAAYELGQRSQKGYFSNFNTLSWKSLTKSFSNL